MAKKTKKRDRTLSGMALKDETKHGVLIVIFFLLSIFSILAIFNGAGVAGDYYFRGFSFLFGVGYFLLPVLFALLGISFMKAARPNLALRNTLGSVLFILSTLGIVDIVSFNNTGGILGHAVAYPFLKLFDVYLSILFLGALLIISLLVMFDKKPRLIPLFSAMGTRIRSFFGASLKKRSNDYDTEYEEEENPPAGGDEEDPPAEGEDEEYEEEENPPAGGDEDDEEDLEPKKVVKRVHSSYTPPPLSLLAGDRGKPGVGDIKSNANIIKRTLSNFGIEVEMDEVTIGPTVTRYALKPAEGVKLSKILSLQNDLALALAAHPLRIEAPIPGKSLVGIEIPNKTKSIVGLATLLSDESFKNSTKPLTVALGKMLNGKSLVASISKMPHLLIAGATGSGKSVTIHAIITSLLYQNGPEDLRLIMVDPKRVELTLYNNIPHLLTPVITDAKKAILALKWAIKEMERRYNILEEHSVRDISSYLSKMNKSKKKEEMEKLPYIVIIIDELADIMSAYPRELEAAIVRLAQMSRAIGIHVLLSTQRPSVNVITGLIKANIPARIALQVSSQIDSRTILDASGAEKLIGAGDMLYASGQMSQPQRVQSAFITEDEVKKVVDYLINQYRDDVYGEEINFSGGGISHEKSIFESSIDDDSSDDDEMYESARELVMAAGKASTSYLQRRLKIGYSRAARIIDMLEDRGVVGPPDGSKPREVLEKPDNDPTARFEEAPARRVDEEDDFELSDEPEE